MTPMNLGVMIGGIAFLLSCILALFPHFLLSQGFSFRLIPFLGISVASIMYIAVKV